MLWPITYGIRFARNALDTLAETIFSESDTVRRSCTDFAPDGRTFTAQPLSGGQLIDFSTNRTFLCKYFLFLFGSPLAFFNADTRGRRIVETVDVDELVSFVSPRTPLYPFGGRWSKFVIGDITSALHLTNWKHMKYW